MFSNAVGVPLADAGGDDEAGAKLARSLCARCHDVAGEGPSPVPAAPPFPTVVTRWPPAYLAEALAEGITVGHSGEVRMPEFQLNPKDIDALVTYLEGLMAN